MRGWMRYLYTIHIVRLAMVDSRRVTVFLFFAVLLVTTNCRERANYRFTTCGSSDREGPTYMECTEHYCNSESLVCGHLLSADSFGSQIFVVPRSGNYTVTIAGASGGHGVCSNHSGLGVIANKTVQFRRGEILRILVGQQGMRACDGHQNIDICQVLTDIETCANLWNTTYRNMVTNNMVEVGSMYYSYDGGGGGGGASLIQLVNDNLVQLFDGTLLPIVIAPGGGGAGAVHDITSILSLLNISHNGSYNLDAHYMNYTNGHAFETSSDKVNGTRGETVTNSARAGAGFFSSVSDASALSMFGHGSRDCNDDTARFTLFPNTHGGFGGGGGGCNGGGGGGGYTGGSIIADGAAIAGEGGYSWPNPPWPFVEYNDGDGYVELFLESCGCTHNCTIYDSSFECTCPSDTVLALNGFDCYREENYIKSDRNQTLFSHSTYGEITADIIHLNNSVFAYSAAVIFSNDSSSDSCAVLFADSNGYLIATSKFINRLRGTQFLEMFLANTSSMQNMNVSVNVSVTSKQMLEEPLYITSVMIFGINGNCSLEKLVVNASIDDIHDFNLLQVQLDVSDTALLSAYLDSFDSMSMATTSTNDDAELSAGAITGIVIAVVVVIISVMVVLAVGVYFCHHHHRKSGPLDDSYYAQNSGVTKADGNFQKADGNFQKAHQKDCVSHDYHQYPDIISHEYEKLTLPRGTDSIQNTESESGVQPRMKTLKYGFHSPLQDYHCFNCSRQNGNWSYDREQLTYMREIGEGQFGKVLLMKAKDICGIQGSVLVAVKTLTSRDPKDIQRFSEEMGLMKKFIHPNIVSLLGHCEATSDGAPMMILELMQHGDLKWFLQSNRPSEAADSIITENVSLNIVIDIANALEYLATNNYVHRDVAARNCLIGERFKAKLSDFGLARGVHEKDYYRVTGKSTLPVKWLAPESLLYGKFASTSDVWSFGVLIWEIATYGEVPHENLQTRDIIEMAANGTLKLNSPVGCPEILASLISQCTRMQPEDRPMFTEVLEFCGNKNLSTTVGNSASFRI